MKLGRRSFFGLFPTLGAGVVAGKKIEPAKAHVEIPIGATQRPVLPGRYKIYTFGTGGVTTITSSCGCPLDCRFPHLHKRTAAL